MHIGFRGWGGDLTEDLGVDEIKVKYTPCTGTEQALRPIGGVEV